MILNRFKKRIILFFSTLFGLFVLLFLLLNSPFIQDKLFTYFSKSIEDQYSIKIKSNEFYYNFFNNTLSTSFLILDHHNDSMIFFPKISVKFNNSVFLNNNLMIHQINMNESEFFIKKYNTEDLTNVEIFLNKINDQKSSSFSSIEIEQINLKDCNLLLDIDNLNKSYKSVNITFDKFSFFLDDIIEINQISLEHKKSNFSSNIYYDFSNQSWYCNFYNSSFDINEIEPNLYGTLDFTSKIEGKSNQIGLKDFHVKYNDSSFEGNFQFDKNKNFITGDINHFFFSENDLKNIIYTYSGNSSNVFTDLGDLQYNGTIQFSFQENIETEGLIRSKYGDIQIDLNCLLNSNSFSDLSYSGIVILNNFEVGEYLKNDLLGKVSFETLIEGTGLDLDFRTKLDFKDGKIDFNNYSYNNITLSGEMSSKYYKGDLKVNDINGNIDFSGIIDFSYIVPKFDFGVSFSNLDFNKLKFNFNDSIKNFSGNFDANFLGTNLNNFEGKLSANKISYFKKNTESIDNISFIFSKNNTEKSIVLESEIGYGNFTSNFDYNNVFKVIENIFISYFQNKKIDYSGQDFFDFNLVLDDASFFTNLLYTNLDLGQLVISSDYNLDNNYILNANISDIYLNDQYVKNCKLQLTGLEEKVDCDIFLNKIKNKNKTLLDSLHFEVKSKEGNLEYVLNWMLKDSLLYNGSLKGDYLFKDNHNVLSFEQSKFYLADRLWEITQGSTLVTTNKTFSFNNFILESSNQKIYLSGGYNDLFKIYIDFTNFDIDLINFFRKKDASKFAGNLDGTIWYSSKEKPIGGYMKIKDFSMNDVVLGEMVINAQSDNIRSSLILDAYIKPLDVQKTLNLNGTLLLDGSNNMDMMINFNGFDPKFLDPLLNSISKPKGKLFGQTRFYGPHDNYFIDGLITVDSLIFKIPYLNTTYYLNQEYNILFEKDNIFLDSITFFDFKHNTSGSFLGNVKHSNAFRSVYYDLDISSDSMYCLNTNLSHNILYYGDVFASGNVLISGDPKGVFFNIKAKSKRGTKFNIPLSYFSDLGETEFIRFIDNQNINLLDPFKTFSSDYFFIMDFDLEINPDAQVRLIYDENIGDVIEGNGFGNLSLKMEEDGIFNIYGDVIIEEGEYLFTMQNIVNKNFKIENGGTLHWKGDPYNADIDFYANYEANTSLKLLDNDYNYNTKLPVICRMHMTEKLLSPEVNFIINIPDATDIARAKLDQLTDSPQKLLQQFAFLLVSNSFLVEESGEDYLNNSLTVTGTELISNQLSNWLSQTTDDFDLGFKWIPGSSDSLTTDQVEIALSKKFLNDRLTINGNASNANTPEAQAVTSIVGEVDIQYDLDESGRIKLKVFNRADAYDPLYGDEFRYEQGVGLFYKKEFNKLFDLFRKKIR